MFYRYVVRRLYDSQAAEDVVQETFLAAIKSADTFRGDSKESIWLSSILRNKTIDWIRKREQQRRNHGNSSENSVDNFAENQCTSVIGASFSTAPWESLSSAEFLELVHEGLARLPQKHADVFVLREFEQITTDVICDILDITPANFWVRLHGARLGLAKHISSKLSD
jgi:RNA polymerase sigma-70 factor (ECF subfamily)